MSEYNEGDIVEAVKGDTAIRGRAVASFGKHILGYSGQIVEDLECIGFTLTVIEKAAPKIVLPSEPGIYADNEGDYLIVYSDGDIQQVERHKMMQTSKRKPLAADTDYAPFTKLEPVNVTAKKVMQDVRGRAVKSSSHEYNGKPVYELTEFDFETTESLFGVQS